MTGQTAGVPFSEDKLAPCISCGLCLPACPTYAMTGDERSSPRGRINLMRAIQRGDIDLDSAASRDQSSECLGCRACEPVCPAGVEYGHLLEEWRDSSWKGRRTPVVAALARRGAEFGFAIRWLGRWRGAARNRRTSETDRRHSLMLGCAERVLFPMVSRAAVHVKPNLEVDDNQGCCGALHAHNGDARRGAELARELGDRLPEVIVTTSGGCSAHLAAILGRDRVLEFSEYLLRQPTETDELADTRWRTKRLEVDGRPARIGLQDSCHARNALGIIEAPRDLIRAIGEFVEVPGAASCCGAAGTYSLMRPRESKHILARRVDAVVTAEIDILAVLNPGCYRQMASGLKRAKSRIQVLHVAELAELALSEPQQTTH